MGPFTPLSGPSTQQAAGSPVCEQPHLGFVSHPALWPVLAPASFLARDVPWVPVPNPMNAWLALLCPGSSALAFLVAVVFSLQKWTDVDAVHPGDGFGSSRALGLREVLLSGHSHCPCPLSAKDGFLLGTSGSNSLRKPCIL